MPFHLEWLSNFTKPFANVFNPLTERVGKWLGRRKPKLYVHFEPSTMFWCIATHGSDQMMQITFVADINHDDDQQALVIVDTYPHRTKSQMNVIDKFTIPPETIITQRIAAISSREHTKLRQ